MTDAAEPRRESETAEPAHGNARADQEARSVPKWIANDGLLRDEGTLFGLAQASPEQVEAKVQVIRDVYDGLIAHARHKEERLNERAAHLQQKRDALAGKREALKAKIAAPDVPAVEGADAHTPHTLTRHVIGFVIAVFACLGTFFLIYEQFQAAFEHAFWITLGVTLAGFFSVFSPVSLLFTSTATHTKAPEAPERWKVYLVELAMPLTAATFVALWRVGAHPWPRLVGLWLLLAIAFLVVGKLLLSTVPQIALLFKLLKRKGIVRWRRRRHRKALEALDESDGQALRDAHDRLQADWEALDTTRPLEKLCARKIGLFQSEYALARRFAETHPRRAAAIVQDADA